MKPNYTQTISHEGNMPAAERTSFGLHAASLSHLMSILTDMYADPMLAVIREYSTNAADAHAAIGSDAPITVTLPNAMSPTYVVTDSGIGMSRETIENSYGQYGYSSKRETDDQTGMLGLGCKSALTFTTQFTLTSVKDGMKTVAMVSRDETGVGFLQVLSHIETVESNGTSIKIPVPISSVNTFNRKAKEFFMFWRPGTVIVDCEPAASFKEVYAEDGRTVIEIDPDIYVVSGYSEGSTIIMGNVPYTVANRYVFSAETVNRGWSLVAFVPMASVEFPPARETLHLTGHTLETLDTLREYVHVVYPSAFKKQVDACPTISKAAVLINGVKNLLKNHGVDTWRGQDIPKYLVINGCAYQPLGGKTSAVSKLPSSVRPTSFAVVGVVVVGVSRPTLKLKRQVDQYVVDNKTTIPSLSTTVWFVEKLDDARFVEGALVSVDEVRKTRLVGIQAPLTPRGKYRQVLGNGSSVAQCDEIDSTYAHIVRVPSGVSNSQRQSLVSLEARARCVSDTVPFFASIYKGQDVAFVKRNPTSISIDEYLVLVRDQLAPKWTADVEHSIGKSLQHVPTSAGVLDPELKSYIEDTVMDCSRRSTNMDIREAVSWFNNTARSFGNMQMLIAENDSSAWDAREAWMKKNYVLLYRGSCHVFNGDDWTELVNALYLARLHKDAVGHVLAVSALADEVDYVQSNV